MQSQNKRDSHTHTHKTSAESKKQIALAAHFPRLALPCSTRTATAIIAWVTPARCAQAPPFFIGRGVPLFQRMRLGGHAHPHIVPIDRTHRQGHGLLAGRTLCVAPRRLAPSALRHVDNTKVVDRHLHRRVRWSTTTKPIRGWPASQ